MLSHGFYRNSKHFAIADAAICAAPNNRSTRILKLYTSAGMSTIRMVCHLYYCCEAIKTAPTCRFINAYCDTPAPCRRWPIPFWNFPNEMGTECWMNCCQQFINLCSCFVCWVQDFPNFVCWRVKRLKIYTILLFTFSKHPNRMPFHMYSRKTYSNDCTMYIRYKWAQNAARKTMIDHIA